MTLNDLLKRIDKQDYDKVIIISDGKGWTNIEGKVGITDSCITLYKDDNTIFSDVNGNCIKKNEGRQLIFDLLGALDFTIDKFHEINHIKEYNMLNDKYDELMHQCINHLKCEI